MMAAVRSRWEDLGHRQTIAILINSFTPDRQQTHVYIHTTCSQVCLKSIRSLFYRPGYDVLREMRHFSCIRLTIGNRALSKLVKTIPKRRGCRKACELAGLVRSISVHRAHSEEISADYKTNPFGPDEYT